MKVPGKTRGRWVIGKTSASKPFEDASLSIRMLSKPGAIAVFWDKLARSLMTGRAAVGV